jgi:hypothetical protein
VCKQKEIMNKTEYALESFKNIQELIRFIDQKSGAVLVLAGLIFTGYIDFIKSLEFVSFKDATFFGLLTFIASIATLICLTVVVYISIFNVLKPRLAKNYTEEEFSLFYFEHLQALGKENVNKEYKSLNENQMTKYIIDQQHEVSVILNKKTVQLGKSFNWLFFAFVFFALFILLTNTL